MRLITHNMLMCHKRGCTAEHFPLRIEPAKLEVRGSEFNAAFVAAMVPKLEWAALVSAARDCGQTIPAEAPTPANLADAAFLKALHDILLDLHVEEGALVCTHCGRRYPVRDGIPNMLLTDDEF